MKLFKTDEGTIALVNDRAFLVEGFDWNALFRADKQGQSRLLDEIGSSGSQIDMARLASGSFLPPIAGQEIWAAGVTYYRSRDARMAESEKAGGGSFYDRVYDAERPELFYKGSIRTAVGHGTPVRIRADSAWNVPEPELALAIDSSGRIFGFTIGNDMSSRDIEGENPLYLPQAKVYDGSAALGPCLLVVESLPDTTEISIRIERSGVVAFEGTTHISEIKRPFDSLAAYLYRDNTFQHGTYLLTGTGIVPPDDFTLASGDRVAIGIVPIGTLENSVQ